jgi:hypothetical protein
MSNDDASGSTFWTSERLTLSNTNAGMTKRTEKTRAHAIKINSLMSAAPDRSIHKQLRTVCEIH